MLTFFSRLLPDRPTAAETVVVISSTLGIILHQDNLSISGEISF